MSTQIKRSNMDIPAPRALTIQAVKKWKHGGKTLLWKVRKALIKQSLRERKVIRELPITLETCRSAGFDTYDYLNLASILLPTIDQSLYFHYERVGVAEALATEKRHKLFVLAYEGKLKIPSDWTVEIR